MMKSETVKGATSISYRLETINNRALIVFTKHGSEYEIEITQNKVGQTQMTDYYQYDGLLTHAEFSELERLINRVEDAVRNMKTKQNNKS